MTQDPRSTGVPGTPDAGESLLDKAVQAARIGPDEASTASALERAQRAIFASAGASPCASLRPDIQALVEGLLAEDRASLVADHCSECLPCRKELVARRAGTPVHAAPLASPLGSGAEPARGRQGRRLTWMTLTGLAATVGFATLVAFGMRHDAPVSARVTSIEGQLLDASAGTPIELGASVPEGLVLRTSKGSRAMLELPDGSRVEMNERAQASFRADADALTVALERGDIIFAAAPRKERNLFVETGACRVAVKGTVFTVRRSLKGSRVGVLEGSVHVDRDGHLSVLGPGDQFASDPSFEPQDLHDQVAWSLEAGRWGTLLAEIDAAAAAVEAAGLGGIPRHESSVLEAMPDSTVFFAALPNDGELSRLASEISERVAANPELREWWDAQMDPAAGQANFARGLDVLQRLSDALGDEVVLALLESPGTRVGLVPVLASPVRDEAELRRLIAEAAGDTRNLRMLAAEDLAGDTPLAGGSEMLVVLHDGHVLASPFADALATVVEGLDGGAPHGTKFLSRLQGQYDRGAEFLVAADLARTIRRHAEVAASKGAVASGRTPEIILGALGVQAVDQFVLTAGKNDPGTAVVSFTDRRSGVAAWLAEPGPMGSLQFVTPEATLAVAALFTDPAHVMSDVEALLPEGRLAEVLSAFSEETGVDLREDLVGSLGGEMALALDGPVLPQPSWKLVLEVDDPVRLERALATLAARAAEVARQQGLAAPSGPLVRDTKTSQGSARALQFADGFELHYAIENGYFVATPSLPLLDAALQASARGTSLATSPALMASLPGGSRDVVSLVAWQDASRLFGASSASGSAAAAILPPDIAPLLEAAATPAAGWARASDRAIAFGVGGPNGGLGGGLATLLRRHVVEGLARHALTGPAHASEDASAGANP